MTGSTATLNAAICVWFVLSFSSVSLAGHSLKVGGEPAWTALVLTGAALFFGAVSHLYLRIGYSRPAATPSWGSMLVASQLHLCAVLLVFLSMGQSSVWLTYSVKGLEPVLGWALLAAMGEDESKLKPTRIAELGLVVVGTFMITYQPQSGIVWTSTSMGMFQTGVATALISNAACCLRSVTSAQIMREYDHYTPIYLYSELSMWALGLLGPYAMVGYLLSAPNDSPSASSGGVMIAAAGLTHYLYYVASYIVLKHLSVLRHSVLNVAKRTTSVLAGLLLLGEKASALGLIGAALTALASFAFCRDAPPKAQSCAGRMTAKRPSTPRTILWTGLLLVSAYSLQIVVDKSSYRSSQFKARISAPFHPSVEDSFLGKIEHADQTSVSPVASAPSPSMDGWYECLQDTSSRFAEQLRADLDDPGRKRAVVLVDIPLHTNLGDVFMVLGEIRALMKLGYQVRHVCHQCQSARSFPHSVTACNSTLIGELVGNDGAVIAHGGGNWGDTWEAVHMCRKKLLPDLASAGVRRFIGMPQSMFYQPSTKQKKLQSDNTAIHKAHQAGMNVTLYWRQADSYEDAQSRITSANNVMTPDAAWAIGPLFPNRAPTVDVLFLLRRDKESKPGYKQIKTELEPVLADCGVTHAEIDWFDVASRPEYRPTLVAADAHEFAEMLTLTANTMLSQGRVLVTNRLHATILATLMGMPVFYADNTYGKIHATRAGSLQHPSCTSDNLRAWGFPSVVGAAQAAIKYTRLHHRTMPASETDAIDEK